MLGLYLHRPQTRRRHRRKAARAGVHVMTEKPMATRRNDGLKIVEACDETGVRLFVVKQNRRNSTLQLLKRAIDEKFWPYPHGSRQRILVPPSSVLRLRSLERNVGTR